MACTQDTYWEYLSTPVTQDSLFQFEPSTTTEAISVHTPSFLQIVLIRCQILFGCPDHHIPNQSRVMAPRCDSESDAGKQEIAILSLIGVISQSSLPHLFPHFKIISLLLTHGFSCPQPEARIICLEIVESCLRNTALPPLAPSLSLSHAWRVGDVVVASDWMLQQLQEVVTCSNDVEAKVCPSLYLALTSNRFAFKRFNR